MLAGEDGDPVTSTQLGSFVSYRSTQCATPRTSASSYYSYIAAHDAGSPL